jgi:hypothetical protein
MSRISARSSCPEISIFPYVPIAAFIEFPHRTARWAELDIARAVCGKSHRSNLFKLIQFL